MRRIITAITAAILLQACSADTTAPATVITGSYQAISQGTSSALNRGVLSFTTTTNGETTDWLSKGAEVTLELQAGGVTAGRLVLPDLDDEGNESAGSTFTADLAGTWTINGNKVTLDHEADTFLRDMEFIVESSTLTAEREFDGVRVRLVLLRTA